MENEQDRELLATPAVGHNLLRISKVDFEKPLQEEQNANQRTVYLHYRCTWVMYRNIPYETPVPGVAKIPKRTLYHHVARILSRSSKREVLVWVYNLSRGNYYVREITGDPDPLLDLIHTIHRLNDYLPGIEDFHNAYKSKKSNL